MNALNIDTQVITLNFSKIDERYSRYRLICPKAERAMAASIARYGQLTPVVVSKPKEERYLLVDGFKRLRACRKLEWPDLKATVLQAGERALKVAMLHLNKKVHSITPLEEAVIVQALYREHKLTQPAIATLLGFHKSWVCRRLALIERLAEEVVEQVRLGLVGSGMIRELCKLPRGNQAAALSAICKHQMTCREAAQLVALLLERPRWEADAILYDPEPILSQREPDRPSANEGLQMVLKELSFVNRRCTRLLQRVLEMPQVNSAERSQALKLLDNIEESLTGVRRSTLLQEMADDDF